MTAQQATAGCGYHRGHDKNKRHNCRFSGDEGQKCKGVFGRTLHGISEKFGIPRKGVLVAWIITLIFSFPVGVALFALAWAFVHHPEWFDGLRRKGRGAAPRPATAASAASASSDADDDRPVVGVDFEDPWMEELRRKFDDLEARTGLMEGYVASGDYKLSSEFNKMRNEDRDREDDSKA
ncbi:MAG: hypothetical protein ABID63_16865 [Pseudomonadota bacterium]